MKLSTKVRYGARLMVDLALKNGQGPVMLKDIAQRQRVSKKYLEQIIIGLKKKRLIKSIRGAKGGYVLAKNPARIRLIDIFEAVEGPISLIKCLDNDGCPLIETCVTREIWAQLKEDIKRFLHSVVLESLAKRKIEKECHRHA